MCPGTTPIPCKTFVLWVVQEFDDPHPLRYMFVLCSIGHYTSPCDSRLSPELLVHYACSDTGRRQEEEMVFFHYTWRNPFQFLHSQLSQKSVSGYLYTVILWGNFVHEKTLSCVLLTITVLTRYLTLYGFPGSPRHPFPPTVTVYSNPKSGSRSESLYTEICYFIEKTLIKGIHSLPLLVIPSPMISSGYRSRGQEGPGPYLGLI